MHKKIFKTLDEQIELLRGKGLAVNDIEYSFKNITGGIQKNKDNIIIRTNAHLFALSLPFP